MKRLLVTAKLFNGIIPFRILQRGRVLTEGTFSGNARNVTHEYMKWMPRMKI